jgi:hypothetical protein
MTAQHTGDPVFLDRTGRRRRLFTLAGTAGGLLLAVAVLALLAGFTGVEPAALPGWGDATPAPGPSRGAAATTTTTATQASRSTTAPPAPRPVTRVPSSPSASADPAPAPTTSPAPTPTATRKAKGRGHVPTHTPSARPPKKP